MGPHKHTPAGRQSRRRRGAVSIWAIVCLVLVAGIGATLVRVALTGSRHMIQERRRSQAAWMSQAGWSLAKSQLRRNADYTGETWNIPATDLGGADAGRVLIHVTAPASGGDTESRDVSVVVEFPVESDRRAQLTRQATIKVPKG